MFDVIVKEGLAMGGYIIIVRPNIKRGANAPNEKAKFALQQDLDRKSYLLQKQNAAYKDYCKQNDLRELQDRLMIAKWSRQNAAKARGAAKRYKTAKGID